MLYFKNCLKCIPLAPMKEDTEKKSGIRYPSHQENIMSPLLVITVALQDKKNSEIPIISYLNKDFFCYSK